MTAYQIPPSVGQCRHQGETDVKLREKAESQSASVTGQTANQQSNLRYCCELAMNLFKTANTYKYWPFWCGEVGEGVGLGWI